MLQLGFIARTPRGRVALPNAYKHLGKKLSAKNQEYLKMFDSSGRKVIPLNINKGKKNIKGSEDIK